MADTSLPEPLSTALARLERAVEGARTASGESDALAEAQTEVAQLKAELGEMKVREEKIREQLDNAIAQVDALLEMGE